MDYIAVLIKSYSWYWHSCLIGFGFSHLRKVMQQIFFLSLLYLQLLIFCPVNEFHFSDSVFLVLSPNELGAVSFHPLNNDQCLLRLYFIRYYKRCQSTFYSQWSKAKHICGWRWRVRIWSRFIMCYPLDTFLYCSWFIDFYATEIFFYATLYRHFIDCCWGLMHGNLIHAFWNNYLFFIVLVKKIIKCRYSVFLFRFYYLL